jgi:hypothetical protein
VISRLHHRQWDQTSTFFSFKRSTFKPSNVQTLFRSPRHATPCDAILARETPFYSVPCRAARHRDVVSDHPMSMGVLLALSVVEGSERSESKDLSRCVTPLSSAFRHSTKSVCPERASRTRALSPLVAPLSPLSTTFTHCDALTPLSSAFTKNAGCRTFTLSVLGEGPLLLSPALTNFQSVTNCPPLRKPFSFPFFSTTYALHYFATPLFSHSSIIAGGGGCLCSAFPSSITLSDYPARSDFRTLVESIGLPTPEILSW